MQICPKCGNQVNDGVVFCQACGNQMGMPQQAVPQPAPVYASPVQNYDPYDHTAEFDAKDISDNKVISMLVYLMGWIGIVIALLAANKSEYAGFHVRQALKFAVLEILSGIAGALVGFVSLITVWTVILPIIGAIAALALGVFMIVLWVVKIICFFQICSGKAKEPAIIRNFTFLK